MSPEQMMMQRLEQLVAPLSAQISSVSLDVKTEIQALAGRIAMLEEDDLDEEGEGEDENGEGGNVRQDGQAGRTPRSGPTARPERKCRVNARNTPYSG